MTKLFPYSGSKSWLVEHLPTLPPHKRIVEPYAGGMAFSIHNAVHHRTPFIGFEREQQLCWIYNYLRALQQNSNCKEACEELASATLYTFDGIRQSLVGTQVTEGFPNLEEDTDERKCAFALIRLCCSGLYVGAFTSKKVYPQHSLPKYLPTVLSQFWGVDWQVFNEDASHYAPQEGDLVLIDPPYLRTTGGYKNDKTFTIDHTHNIIRKCQDANVPFMVTYGTGAQQDFPMLEGWRLLRQKTTSNILRTGTNVREENLYVSWT